MSPAVLLCASVLVFVVQTPAAQDAVAPKPDAGGSKMGADKPAFKQEELDQMLAPIALHPDDLLAQMLMAATYPVELVQADRWVKANAKLKGDALAKELEKQTWDASVKSLVNCPQVLVMMSEKLDWTVNLGNAFLGQQKEVMDTIQKLRKKAKEAGNLESGKEQKVSTETEAGEEVIVIEPADPEVIYVPSYSPSYIYGPWWYPAYPPYYWYPPGYVPPPHPAFHFSMGIAIGVAWGYAWGGCHWGHSEVDIDIDRNVERNRNIDRGKYAQQLDKAGTRNGKGNWKHDASHRGNVAYRDASTAKRVGGATPSDTARSRDSFRGRTEAPATADRAAGDRFKTSREVTERSSADRSAQSRAASAASNRSSGFEGVRDGGSSARAASDRGRSSRSASSSPSARPRGGGSRGGGGRGGGGRR